MKMGKPSVLIFIVPHFCGKQSFGTITYIGGGSVILCPRSD